MPIGMKVPLHIVAKDELQFRDHNGDWLPLPIVETEKQITQTLWKTSAATKKCKRRLIVW